MKNIPIKTVKAYLLHKLNHAITKAFSALEQVLEYNETISAEWNKDEDKRLINALSVERHKVNVYFDLLNFIKYYPAVNLPDGMIKEMAQHEQQITARKAELDEREQLIYKV